MNGKRLDRITFEDGATDDDLGIPEGVVIVRDPKTGKKKAVPDVFRVTGRTDKTKPPGIYDVTGGRQ